MTTFKEWWLRQFLPQEHRYSAEMSWMYCYALMERSCNTRIAEAISTQIELIEQLEKSAVLTQQNIMNYKATISIQQATIDRLTDQRDRLVRYIKGSGLNGHDTVNLANKLIAEIEASK